MPRGQPKPLAPYRTSGVTAPDAECLLDVLAAAGASHVSGQPFALAARGDGGAFPALLPRHVHVLRETVAGSAHQARLDGGVMDFLRGAGRIGTLAGKMARLAAEVDEAHVLAWTEHQASEGVSLRIEADHESDVPTALRADTMPRPRHSHPGRNLLAAYALCRTPHDLFVASPEDPFMAPRYCPVPLRPMAWEEWCAARPGEADALWLRCMPQPHGKVVALSQQEMMLPGDVLALAGRPYLGLRGEDVLALPCQSIRLRGYARVHGIEHALGSPGEPVPDFAVRNGCFLCRRADAERFGIDTALAIPVRSLTEAAGDPLGIES